MVAEMGDDNSIVVLFSCDVGRGVVVPVDLVQGRFRQSLPRLELLTSFLKWFSVDVARVKWDIVYPEP